MRHVSHPDEVAATSNGHPPIGANASSLTRVVRDIFVRVLTECYRFPFLGQSGCRVGRRGCIWILGIFGFVLAWRISLARTRYRLCLKPSRRSWMVLPLTRVSESALAFGKERVDLPLLIWVDICCVTSLLAWLWA